MNNNLMNLFQNFMQNPYQMLAQRGINLPQGMNDPNAIIQHLMDSGKVDQQAYNEASQRANQMKNNPMFRQLFR